MKKTIDTFKCVNKGCKIQQNETTLVQLPQPGNATGLFYNTPSPEPAHAGY